jgi:uncharacterized protein
MVNRFRRLAARYTAIVARHERLVLWLTLASFLISLWAASSLKLKSDLKELLPPDYESVRELDRVLDRVGGVGTLIAVVQSPDLEQNKRFMEDLAKRLQALPPGQIRSINYKADEIRAFYEDHFLYYMEPADLSEIYARLKRRIDYEKFKRMPFFLELGEGAGEPAKLDFEDMRSRYEKRFTAPVTTIDDYYGGEWGQMLVMMIRPYGATISIDSARSLIAAVDSAVADLDPASYDPRMRVDYCGDVKSTIEEYETLKHDILSTSVLCVSLVSLAILLYFLRVRSIFLLGATLVIAVSWTFALTRVVIGYLNAQTAFLGSIIVGTGINYGIIVLARYLEERKKHHVPIDAMRTALEETTAPTFLAAATTAVSFVVLMIARIRGLSQFGFIGAVGVMLCWAATIFVLPAMVLASEKVLRLVRPRPVPPRRSAIFEITTRMVAKSPAWILTLAALLAAAAVVQVVRFAPTAMEYDFTKMRNQASVTSGTEALEKRVSRLFKNSMTPSVVLVDSLEEGKEVCAAVDAQNLALPPADRRVGGCHAITDLLPADQEKKLPIMAKIKGLLSQRWLRELTGDARSKVDRVLRSILGRPLTIDDLPPDLSRHFEDKDGVRGAVVFINPRPGMLLSDGRNLLRFADTIRDIRLPDGRVLHAASASLIFSDLIDIIKREAPFLTIASLIGVIAFVLVMLRSLRFSSVIIAALLWGVLLMLGVAARMGIRLNFFNFIVLPLTFGIGVDYAVNIAMRIRQEGPEGIAHAILKTGPAVILCSVTTIIGYFVLTTAANQALATFGVAAVVGEITCIVAAILIVPAVVVLFDRRRRRG